MNKQVTKKMHGGGYSTPALDFFSVTVECGFSATNPWNDTAEGAGDIDISYGGMDNEFE